MIVNAARNERRTELAAERWVLACTQVLQEQDRPSWQSLLQGHDPLQLDASHEQAKTQLKEGLQQYFTEQVATGEPIDWSRPIKEEAILDKVIQWVKENPLEAAEIGLTLTWPTARGAIGLRWGAKLLLNGRKIRNLAALKKIYDMGSKTSQKLVNWLPSSWRKALSNSKARSNECTTVQEVYQKLQRGKNTNKLQKAVEAKIPQNYGAPSLNKTNHGIKYTAPSTGNIIRIDIGNPYARYESGRVDHVSINRGGKVIGRSGEVINATIELRAPSKHPDAHIPLTEWLKWQNRYKP